MDYTQDILENTTASAQPSAAQKQTPESAYPKAIYVEYGNGLKCEHLAQSVSKTGVRLESGTEDAVWICSDQVGTDLHHCRARIIQRLFSGLVKGNDRVLV